MSKMSTSLEDEIKTLSLGEEVARRRTSFGKDMLQHFFFAGFRNLNHGSFGTFPRAIQQKQRALQDLCETQPDPFMRYLAPKLIHRSREAMAKVLNCPAETLVYVSNATTGVNTVLRNLVWNEDGKDQILYFRHIYGACLKTVDYVCEYNQGKVTKREILVVYPMEDAEVVDLFRTTIKACKAEGKRPRIALFDAVSSLPGVRMPFEELTAVCQAEGVLSLIDAAHGVGNVPIDLSTLDPDFLVTNAHKWFFVPRGCAAFYVPLRNQALIRSSLPTSHGFAPKAATTAWSPLPPSSQSNFVLQFEFNGTVDATNYMVVRDAVEWRAQVCGGEDAIIAHNMNLAKVGGRAAATILGTRVLDNERGTLTNCAMVNVLLPLTESAVEMPGRLIIKPQHRATATEWMQRTLIDQHQTFIAVYFFQQQWWARLSAQVYLEMADFAWAGGVLKDISERAGREEFLHDDGMKGKL